MRVCRFRSTGTTSRIEDGQFYALDYHLLPIALKRILGNDDRNWMLDETLCVCLLSDVALHLGNARLVLSVVARNECIPTRQLRTSRYRSLGFFDHFEGSPVETGDVSFENCLQKRPVLGSQSRIREMLMYYDTQH